MMAGWCALVCGNASDAAEVLATALIRSGALARRPARDGLILLEGGGTPVCSLDDGTAILVGHAFPHDAAGGSGNLSWPADDDGAEFVRRHWGAYVAIRATDAGTQVLRDPSAMAPCYLARHGSVWLLTDSPRLLVDHGLLHPAIDWPIVTASLVRHDWRPERTALVGLDEVLPATVVTLREDGAASRRIWQAWTYARPEPTRDLSAEALAETIDRCMAAWSALYPRPLIEISGGLDSGVVAAALAPVAGDPHLITFAAGPGDPMEVGYAQAIADALGLPLEIAEPQVTEVDLTRSNARDLPRPNARAFTQASDACSMAYARAIGADAFASGGGGDDLFGYQRSIAPAIDRLWAEGPGRGVIRTLDDIARVSHATFWEALGRFVRRAATGPRARLRSDLRLLSLEVCASLPAPVAVPEPAGNARAPGKSAQVRGIETLPNHLEGHGRASFAPVLFPLLSQPIVEFCLAVPSWRWCEGGANRSLVRQAFAKRLPPCVIERRSKGAFDGFCARLFDRNRALVGELLLDGSLAAQGIVDRAAVSAALRNPAPSGELVMRLLALVDVEAWLQSWQEVPAVPALQARASGHIGPASPAPDLRDR